MSGTRTATAAESKPNTRLLQLMVPGHALEGDLVVVWTQIGPFEIPISAKVQTLRPDKQINVDIPVPEDFAADSVLVVESVKLMRDGKEADKPPPTAKVRVAVPGQAKKGDLITITTEAGQFDLNVPNKDKVIEVEIPIDQAEFDKLGGKPLTVTKLLLNGVDVVDIKSPVKRKWSFETNKPTRRISFTLPKGVVAGDTLDVCTELGIYQIAVPPKAGKILEANLPVPVDCELPKLNVAWVRKAEENAPASAPSASEPELYMGPPIEAETPSAAPELADAAAAYASKTPPPPPPKGLCACFACCVKPPSAATLI